MFRSWTTSVERQARESVGHTYVVARFLTIFAILMSFALATAQSRTLRPGDMIRLVNQDDPTLCVTRILDFQGEIRLPSLGRVSLAGLSLAEARDLLANLAKITPSQLILSLAPTQKRGVSYMGAVGSMGSLPIFDGLRLSDVVKVAQPTLSADLDAVEIESDTGELLTVDFSDDALHPEQNPFLHSGDRVTFPLATQSAEVSILGPVNKPGTIPYVRGMTVKAAIEASGGLTNHANSKDLRVLRNGVEIKRLDFSTEPTFELKRADTLVVALDAQRRFVTVVGEVKAGGLIAWKEGMTLADAIRDAGGVTPAGDVESLRVQRVLGDDRFRRRMGLSKDKTFALNPNDVIQVPLRGAPQPPETKPTTPKRVVPPR